jgi:hypothetical protein
MSGRIEDGFAALVESAEVGRGEGRSGPGSMATLALAVQVGEPDRAADVLAEVDASTAGGTLGSVESAATLALAAIQTGGRPAAPDPGGRAFGFAVAAMVHAVRGDLPAALAAADAVPECEEATFLDSALGDVAAGLALVRAGRVEEGRARLDAARATLEATDDRVGQGMVRLACAVAAEAAGLDSALSERADAAIALARIGLVAAGWETTFRTAAGLVEPAAV